ncbi:MAG: hypothetical protein ABIK39_02710 [candidate division WOR-3 bacterium]
MRSTEYNRLFFYLFVFLLTLSCGKKMVVWQRIIDRGANEEAVDLLSDGERLIVVGNQDGKGLVEFIDRDGNFLRRQVFSEGKMTSFRGAGLDLKGNLFLCGSVQKNDTSLCLVVKNDLVGRTVWKKGLALGKGSWANGICLIDTNIVICGGVETEKGAEVLVALLNPTGKTLWSRNYSQGEWAEGTKVALAPNRTIILLGKRRDAKNGDIFLLSLKPNGDTIWYRVYDSGGEDTPGDLTVDQFGNIVAVGTAQISDSVRCVLLEYTLDGGVVRKVAYGNNAQAEGKGICLGDKGEIIVCGTLRTPKGGALLVFEYLPNAISVWERQQHIGKDVSGTAVIFAQDVFVAANVTSKSGPGGKDIALTRFAWNKK